jgi:hypothetical protein
VTVESSSSEAPRTISPLWGLWLAFACTLGACAEGVLAGRIPYFQAVAAIALLIGVIRLAAAALTVPSHPLEVEELRVAWSRMRRVTPRRVSSAVGALETANT